MCYTYRMVRDSNNSTNTHMHFPELSLLDAFSGKWMGILLFTLPQKTMRHGELQRAIEGISQKVLTQKLRILERNGIVSRKVYPVVPPYVEYALTPLGTTLIKALTPIGNWARKHYVEAETARKQFDRLHSKRPAR